MTPVPPHVAMPLAIRRFVDRADRRCPAPALVPRLPRADRDGASTANSADAAPAALEEVARLAAAGQLRVPIAANFPAEQNRRPAELRWGHGAGRVLRGLAELPVVLGRWRAHGSRDEGVGLRDGGPGRWTASCLGVMTI